MDERGRREARAASRQTKASRTRESLVVRRAQAPNERGMGVSRRDGRLAGKTEARRSRREEQEQVETRLGRSKDPEGRSRKVSVVGTKISWLVRTGEMCLEGR